MGSVPMYPSKMDVIKSIISLTFQTFRRLLSVVSQVATVEGYLFSKVPPYAFYYSIIYYEFFD